jgi:hypothetical protein
MYNWRRCDIIFLGSNKTFYGGRKMVVTRANSQSVDTELNMALRSFLESYLKHNKLTAVEIKIWYSQVSAILEDGTEIRANKIDRISSRKAENFYLNENSTGKWKRIKL